MPHHLQFEQWVPSALERVFAFFSNPQNLPRIMPASTQTRIDELYLVPPPPSEDSVPFPSAAGVGTVFVTSFRPIPLLPLRARWIARITEFEWNHYFADVQQKGPFKQWHHRHEFQAEARKGVSGTLIRDAIYYALQLTLRGTPDPPHLRKSSADTSPAFVAPPSLRLSRHD